MKTHSLSVLVVITGICIEVVCGAVHEKPGEVHNELPDSSRNRTVNRKDLHEYIELLQPESEAEYHLPPSPETSTAATDSGVKIVRHEDDSWKNVIIIACTIMASIEIVIVGFMITYWKRIRWHLRKLNCPCCVTPESRVGSRDRQGVEMEERNAFTGNVAATVHSDDDDIVEISIVQRPQDTPPRPAAGPSRQSARQQNAGRSQHAQGERSRSSRSRSRSSERRQDRSDRNRDLVEAGPSNVDTTVRAAEGSENHSQHVEAQVQVIHT